MTSTDPIRTVGWLWVGEDLGKPPEGLKSATAKNPPKKKTLKDNNEIMEFTTMMWPNFSSCWMRQGERWWFYRWFHSFGITWQTTSEIKFVTRAGWIRQGSNCTVETVENKHTASFSPSAFYDTQMFWHLCVVLNCQPWAPYGFALTVFDPQQDITKPGMYNSCPSKPSPSLPFSNDFPGWVWQKRSAVIHYAEHLNGEEQCGSLVWFD